MIISHNNPAKEWIFQQLIARAERGPFTVCDVACGSGSVWHAFLQAYPSVSYVGSDTDIEAVTKAKKVFADLPNARFEIADAQKPRSDIGAYDIVTTLSSLEHVVRIDKFLDTIFSIMKPGGIAYLNYDDGHFTSHDIKERVMVPVSQLLAKVGIEGPYMKKVDDVAVVKMIRERGGKILAMRKHNLATMKKFTKQHAKGLMGDEVLDAWFTFEDRLNRHLPPSQLAPIMGATVIVVQKPS